MEQLCEKVMSETVTATSNHGTSLRMAVHMLRMTEGEVESTWVLDYFVTLLK